MADEWAAFVLARVAEEEADARAAMEAGRQGTDGRWHYSQTRGILGGYGDDLIVSEVYDGFMVVADRSAVPMDSRIGTHVARQDPAATLARVEALRALVALHQPAMYDSAEWPHDVVPMCAEDVSRDSEDGASGEWPCDTIRLLAAFWPDHPDHPDRRARAGGS